MKSLFSDSLGYGGEPPIVSVFHCFYNLMVKDTSMIKGMSEKYRDYCMNANHGVLDLFKTLHFTFKFTKVAIFCLYFQRSRLNSIFSYEAQSRDVHSLLSIAKDKRKVQLS